MRELEQVCGVDVELLFGTVLLVGRADRHMPGLVFIRPPNELDPSVLGNRWSV